ncbi:MAG: ATP-binding cassette domain-containing protein [Butyricimonas faecalis]
MMLAIQYIIGQLSVPVIQIANYIYNIQDVKISLERINEIKNQKDENADRHNSLNITDNSIKIKNLSFRYEGSSVDVLKNINLTVDNNETVAIVGSSGSGKTTLLKLILQYYLPQNGCIEMGGTDLRDVNVQSLWDRCGVVMQDGYIFSDTIAKNIATSTDEIDLSRLKYAADMARLFLLSNRYP